MDFGVWTLNTVLSKWLIYGGSAAAIGDVLAWRALGFAALLILALVLLRWPQGLTGTACQLAVSLCALAGVGLIDVSYAAIGPSVDHGSDARPPR
jgi:hypothetical protein